MRVTREWLLETISRIPANTEMDITGHDWSLFVKSDPNYKEPERIPYPPANISRCSVNGTHMWGGNSCRHCGDNWPEPYESERIRITKGEK